MTSLVTVVSRAVPFLFFLLGLVTLLLFLLFLGLLLFAEGYEVTFVNLAVSRLLPDGDDCRRSWDNEFVWQLTGTRLFGVAWSVFKGPAVAVDTSTDWRGHLSCLWFCKTNHCKSVTESTYAFHMPHQEPEHRRGCTDGHGPHEIMSYFFKPRARPMFGNKQEGRFFSPEGPEI